MAKESGPPG